MKFRKLDYSYNHIKNPLDQKEVKIIFNRAYTKALRYLHYRPRSTKEIREFLSKKEFNIDIIQNVIDLLTNQKFLNDINFTEWWVRGRQKQARSKIIIKQELKQKGIASDIIENIFQETQDDFITAQKYFEKKKQKFAKYSGEEYFQKAAVFLQRRGFSWDVVKKVLYNK